MFPHHTGDNYVGRVRHMCHASPISPDSFRVSVAHTSQVTWARLQLFYLQLTLSLLNIPLNSLSNLLMICQERFIKDMLTAQKLGPYVKP